MKRTVLQQL